MLKKEELTNPESCLSRAYPNELIFVLLARDGAAPDAIEAWVKKRIELGKNVPWDSQITEALECARRMRLTQAGIAKCAKGIHSIDTTVSNTICVYCNKDLSEFYKK